MNEFRPLIEYEARGRYVDRTTRRQPAPWVTRRRSRRTARRGDRLED